MTADTKTAMRQTRKEIQNGTFARNWIMENKIGRQHFNMERKLHGEHELEKVGQELRKMYSWSDEK